ncbi:hypothetical protein D9M71_610660 [compost metagenome]
MPWPCTDSAMKAALASSERVIDRRWCGTLGASNGRQRRGPAGSRPASRLGLAGNSEAVWPSSPMPSTSTSIGGSSAKAWSALSAAASRFSACWYRPTKRALAASPFNRWRASRPALLSACSTGTQRSSARLTMTLAQSRRSLASFSRNGTGLRPPDNTTQACPLAAIAARRRSATSWAKDTDSALASASS